MNCEHKRQKAKTSKSHGELRTTDIFHVHNIVQCLAADGCAFKYFLNCVKQHRLEITYLTYVYVVFLRNNTIQNFSITSDSDVNNIMPNTHRCTGREVLTNHIK